MKYFPCSNETRRGWFYVRVQRKLKALHLDEILSDLEAATGSALALNTDAEGFVRISLQRIREILTVDPQWTQPVPSTHKIRDAISVLETLEMLVVDPFRLPNEAQGYAWMFEEPPAWRTNCPPVSDREEDYED